MARRMNTFRIDYSMVPLKPKYEEVHDFVATVLGLKRDEVERVQCSRTLGCAFVKTTELEIAQKVVADNDNKHTIEVEDKLYKLRIRMEDGAVEVKIHDLSEDVEEDAILDFLAEYGEVYGLRELKWGEKYAFEGIPTGIWMAKMVVKKNIPSYVVIDGEATALSYYGQQQTCRHCKDFAHNGIGCVENKKLLVQKTYADAAKQSANAPKPSGSGTRSASHKKPKRSAFNPVSQQPNVLTPPETSNQQNLLVNQHQPISMLPPKQPNIAAKLPEKTKATKTDGNDSDDSRASNSSRRSQRNVAKKARPNEEDINANEVEEIL